MYIFFMEKPLNTAKTYELGMADAKPSPEKEHLITDVSVGECKKHLAYLRPKLDRTYINAFFDEYLRRDNIKSKQLVGYSKSFIDKLRSEVVEGIYSGLESAIEKLQELDKSETCPGETCIIGELDVVGSHIEAELWKRFGSDSTLVRTLHPDQRRQVADSLAGTFYCDFL